MSETTRQNSNCCDDGGDSDALDIVHENRPGAPSLKYRLGRYSHFFERMLNRLPGERIDPEVSERAPLERLTYRGTDDPTVAILDSCAVLLDVLAFYQERIANEGYVRTALERRSVLEMVRAIGYEMRPGVAAGTLLAFVADAGPDTPDSIVVPQGTQVLSIPKKDETPKTYETIEDIETRPEWNQLESMPAIVPFNQEISAKAEQVRLVRGSMRLQPNDVVLLVDNVDTANPVTHVRKVHSVINESASRTVRVRFLDVPESASDAPLQKPVLFGFQSRTRLFGDGAQDPVGQWMALERVLQDDTEVGAVALRAVDGLAFAAHKPPPLWASDPPPRVTFSMWRVENRQLIGSHKLGYDIQRVTAAAFSQDGMYLATASEDTSERMHVDIFRLENMNSEEGTFSSETSEDVGMSSVAQIWFLSAAPDSEYRLLVVDEQRYASQWLFKAAGNTLEQPEEVQGEMVYVGNAGVDPLFVRDGNTESGGQLELDGRNGSVILRTRILEDAIPWPDTIDASEGFVDLARVEEKLVPGGWAVLDTAYRNELDETDTRRVYVRKLKKVSTVQARGFGLQRRVTRLDVSVDPPSGDPPPEDPYSMILARQETNVYIDSVELTLASTEMALPVAHPGDHIGWSGLDEDQEAALSGLIGRTVIIQGAAAPGLVENYRKAGLPDDFSMDIMALDSTGRPMRMVVSRKAEDGYWYLTDERGTGEIRLLPEGALGADIAGFVLDADCWVSVENQENPATSVVEVPRLIPWHADDDLVQETGKIEKVLFEKKQLVFKEPLQNTYDWRTMRILGNVAMATHGEAVNEVLGSGDGLVPNQVFSLKKPPLTYIAGATESGVENTLTVRVNGVLWKEKDSLLMTEPGDEVFIVRNQDDGRTEITFGDGLRGARLPSGEENLVATYRSGIGLDGELDAGQLQLLKTRPLGITEVVNPFPATGGAARERRSEAGENAPRSVLVLGRVVSLQDYEDYAKSYPGVGKARAVAMWDGALRLVHLTVGTVGGEPLVRGSPVHQGLRSALDAVRNTSQRLEIAGFRRTTFDVTAKIMVDSRFEADVVKLAVERHLTNVFAYERREFGQRVSPSEVIVAIQEVDGVVMVDLDNSQFYEDENVIDERSAEIVLIDPLKIVIEVRP